MQVDALPFIEALIVAVIAAVLAGVYPAWRMGVCLLQRRCGQNNCRPKMVIL